MWDQDCFDDAYEENLEDGHDEEQASDLALYE